MTVRAHIYRPRFAWLTILILSCLTLGIRPLSAGEPVLTLAMVDYSSAPSFTFSAPREDAARKNSPVAIQTLSESAPEPVAGTFTSLTLSLQKPQPVRKHPLSISRRNPRDTVWSSASLQAGYGELFSDKTAAVYGRNGTGWEEPACGYLMVHFTF